MAIYGIRAMSKIIVVTSGKGGVGKTTTSASLAMGLAERGYSTVVVDFDIGLRNLDLIMGCESRIVFDLIDVISGTVEVHEALIQDKHNSNLYILAASQTQNKDSLTLGGIENVLKKLSRDFSYIICDSPAGIEIGALSAMHFADEAIIVTNPEISSVRDSDRIVGMMCSDKEYFREIRDIKKHLLITRYSPERVYKGEMLSYVDIKEILSLDIIGIIPESSSVLKSSNAGIPVALNLKSKAGQAYNDMVERLLGNEKHLKFTTFQKKNFLRRLFGI